MTSAFDPQPKVEVLEAEYKRLLGFPATHVMEGRTRELADWARQWYAENGKPWIYTCGMPIETKGGNVRLNGSEFSSRQLHETFREAGSDQAIMVLVSAGSECEEKAKELWQEGKPDEYFFLEIYGSAVVEHLITTTGARVCAWAEGNHRAALPHYSPGYSGWDVADQIPLFHALRKHGGESFPHNIRVLDSGMLQPKKSLLAVIGLTSHRDRVQKFAKLVPCENCSFAPCQYRRAPYRFSLPQIEDVSRLQGTVSPMQVNNSKTSLTQNARYSVHPRALRKWAQERLELRFDPDGRVEARFRYEGTTCSNLGQALEFDYQVWLGSAHEGYKIKGTKCEPRQGDVGHTRMCEYLTNAEQLLSNIEKEKPLLGRPLDDLLAWQRPYDPAGCYCSSSSRTHKWGLVLEVIHFALATRQKADLLGGNDASVSAIETVN
jgi:hypothetical protein